MTLASGQGKPSTYSFGAPQLQPKPERRFFTHLLKFFQKLVVIPICFQLAAKLKARVSPVRFLLGKHLGKNQKDHFSKGQSCQNFFLARSKILRKNP